MPACSWALELALVLFHPNPGQRLPPPPQYIVYKISDDKKFIEIDCKGEKVRARFHLSDRGGGSVRVASIVH